MVVLVACKIERKSSENEGELLCLFADTQGHLTLQSVVKCNRKAMNRNWSNQKSNPALKTKAGNK